MDELVTLEALVSLWLGTIRLSQPTTKAKSSCVTELIRAGALILMEMFTPNPSLHLAFFDLIPPPPFSPHILLALLDLTIRC